MKAGILMFKKATFNSGLLVFSLSLFFRPPPAFAYHPQSLEFFVSGLLAHFVLFFSLISICPFLRRSVDVRSGRRYFSTAILFFAGWMLLSGLEEVVVWLMASGNNYFLNGKLLLNDFFSMFYFTLVMIKPFLGLLGVLSFYQGLTRLENHAKVEEHV